MANPSSRPPTAIATVKPKLGDLPLFHQNVVKRGKLGIQSFIWKSQAFESDELTDESRTLLLGILDGWGVNKGLPLSDCRSKTSREVFNCVSNSALGVEVTPNMAKLVRFYHY
jgi:hypothetical protein